MTTPRIGWYVHHHGRGHLSRFLAVRPHLDAQVTVFSSLAAPTHLPAATEWVTLPLDNDVEEHDGTVLDPAAAEPTAHGRFHWAPHAHRGHRRRLALIAARAERLDAVVVDVSVEVAAFVRLLGLPLALVSQPGPRDDAPHRLAFDIADLIVCPWPEGFHDLSPFGDAVARLHTVGGVSRFAGRRRAEVEPGTVLVLGGIGGVDERSAVWDRVRERSPGVEWRSAGYLPGTFVDDPWEAICRAEVVVSAAGQNSVADIAAAGRPAVLVPQDRPFQEQVTTARALDRAGLAVAVEPAAGAEADRDADAFAEALTCAIDRARSHPPRWETWGVGGGAVSAAALIRELAATTGPAG
jgi:hypothetical protein